MATDPLISVIMPVHNAGPYLRQSVDSVLGQSFADFELIVIDDRSIDGAADFLATHPDERVRYFRNEENLGAARTRNLAIGRSNAEFIAIQDADDISRVNRLAVSLQLFREDPRACVVFGCHRYLGPDDQPLNRYRGDRSSVRGRGAVPTGHEAIALSLRFHLPFGHGSAMFRRTCFVQHTHYERAYEPAEDYFAFAQLLRAGCRFCATDQVLFDYRVHPHGISKTGAARLTESNRTISAHVRAAALPTSAVHWKEVLRNEPAGRRAEPRLLVAKNLLRSTRIENGVPVRSAMHAVLTGLGARGLAYLTADVVVSAIRRCVQRLRSFGGRRATA